MPVANIFRLDKLVVGSHFELQAIENASASPGIQEIAESAAGERQPNFVGIDRQIPMITLTTPQIATVIGAVGVNGLAITGNVDMYFKLATKVGNAARNASNHIRIRCADCICCWSRISLPNQGRGNIELMIYPAFDGTNQPMVYAGSQVLSGSVDASALNYFQCGPVFINGSQLNQVQDITIESGCVEVPEFADGEYQPTYRRIDTGRPVITVRTNLGTGFNSPGPGGVALNGSNGIVAYGRKLAANSHRVANATAQHLSFTGLNGMVTLQDSRGNGTAAVEDTLRVSLSTPSDTSSIMTIVNNATLP